jgi:alkanesulfonate monooxygenase SsuD/methylene tetrahydromethanopterin reductase-like flavin-dependent oxidoreductase (luciferase family)
LRAGHLGRHAIVDLSPERMHEKIGWVHEGAARAGRAPHDITLSVNCWLVRVTPDRDAARGFLDRIATQYDVTVGDLEASPSVLVGTVDTICEKLDASRREYGFDHVQVDAGFHPRSLDSIVPVVTNLAGP